MPDSDQRPEARLHIVTATVVLSLDINGQKAVIDINRLAREPFWSISVWEKPEGEITLTRNEEIEEEFAKFNLTCGSACKRNPVSGVIGVQKGTTIPMV